MYNPLGIDGCQHCYITIGFTLPGTFIAPTSLQINVARRPHDIDVLRVVFGADAVYVNLVEPILASRLEVLISIPFF